MDDMTAFERQVQRRVQRFVGPARPVDDLAVFEAVTAASRSHRWGFDMFSALKLATATAIVALFGGLLLIGVPTTPHGDEALPATGTEAPSPTGAFPTGVFVAIEDGRQSVEFRADGTCRWLDQYREEVLCAYAANGDLYTEMTFEPWDPPVKTPATFYWDWDGQTLSFEQYGDAFPERWAYTDYTYRPIPDPIEVVVANRDAVAGYIVVPALRYVASTEAGPDTYTDVLAVKGRKAAVAISEGTPITEDLLEPAAE